MNEEEYTVMVREHREQIEMFLARKRLITHYPYYPWVEQIFDILREHNYDLPEPDCLDPIEALNNLLTEFVSELKKIWKEEG